MENKVVKAKDLAVDDVTIIYGCKWIVYVLNSFRRCAWIMCSNREAIFAKEKAK